MRGVRIKVKLLRTIRNYLCYCGIEKDEYNALKRDAYRSNFRIWRILTCLIGLFFLVLFIYSLFGDFITVNRPFYLLSLIFFAVSFCLFFVIKEDSILAQFLIYLIISMLFFLSILIALGHPDIPAVMFIVMIIITPMFMIDKPYFMGLELAVASAIFLIWMRAVKPYDVWQIDFANVVVYSVAGFVIHVVSNSIRIKEFVLTRRINIQKDTDDLTGLKNKGALTRGINDYLNDPAKNKGIMFLLDIDYFKKINDTYGHDYGDEVIRKLGDFLGGYFNNGEIVGRFGGDEFVFFVKDTDDPSDASRIANGVISGVSESIPLPEEGKSLSVSIGAALYRGEEKNYSDIFKKADTALYDVKADRTYHFKIYE